LCLVDEAQIAPPASNRFGSSRLSALPHSRAAAIAEPLVEHHAQALHKELMRIMPGLGPAIPRWPGGRRHAIVVTHDTDAVCHGHVQEVLYNSVKAVLRRDPLRLRMAWDGVRGACHDATYCFRTWADIEAAQHVRSGFFLSGRARVSRHLNDCRSTVFNTNVDWTLLRRMADDGFEFGLHPAINAKDDVAELHWGKHAIEERLQRPIHGLRHHYFAIDWQRPHLTLRQHALAGFRYDSSIAISDAAGFRAGTCLPYRPFDPERGEPLELLELPLSLMDLCIINSGGNIQIALQRATDLLDRVRRVGGVLILDWHTESAFDGYCYSNYRTVLTEILKLVALESDAWIVTPSELARHWSARAKALIVS